MGKSKPNQVRYNDKISAIRREIAAEKSRLAGESSELAKQIEELLKRRSPVDLGDLKKSWSVKVGGKSKLKGHSLSDLSQSRPIKLTVQISSSSRHAAYQMFGWKAVPGQLLTGVKYGGKFRVMMASKPVFRVSNSPKKRRKKHGGNQAFSFVTRGGEHRPSEQLAFSGGQHSIHAEMKRLLYRIAKNFKYITVSDIKVDVSPAAIVSGRIAKWMENGLGKSELNSRAVFGARQKGTDADGKALFRKSF